MDHEEPRGRRQTASARIAERPLVSWVGHTGVFALMHLLLQVAGDDEVHVVESVILGAIIAAALVIGTLIGARVRGR